MAKKHGHKKGKHHKKAPKMLTNKSNGGKFVPQGRSITDPAIRPLGMSIEIAKKVDAKNARRGKIAVMTDRAKKASIDRTGEKWLHNPNRYDIPGVDAKITIK